MLTNEMFDKLLSIYCSTKSLHWTKVYSSIPFLLFLSTVLKFPVEEITNSNSYKAWHLDKSDDAYYLYGV